MDLLERYLQAVRFWLPKKQKDDIIAELSEDLRSQVDEKEHELGHPLTEDEVEVILKQCGPPRVVANRYLPQRYLIGPVVFPIYWLVLRTALLWSLGPWLLAWSVLTLFVPDLGSAHPGAAVVETMKAMLWVGFSIAAAVTLAFAVLERLQAKTGLLERWNPRELPPLVKRPQTVRRSESIAGLVFGAVFLAWWLAVPHDWRLVFGPGAGIFTVSPTLHSYYVPVIVLTLLGLAQNVINLFRPQWTWLPPATRLITTAVGLGIANSIKSAYPYVVLTDAAVRLARYEKVAVIVNQSIFVSVVVTEIVMFILVIVYAIQCVLAARRWMEGDRNPAALHV
jgi:hypothetical protein